MVETEQEGNQAAKATIRLTTQLGDTPRSTTWVGDETRSIAMLENEQDWEAKATKRLNTQLGGMPRSTTWVGGMTRPTTRATDTSTVQLLDNGQGTTDNEKSDG